MKNPPDYLDADAKAKWREVWPSLNPKLFDYGRDQDVLAMYCSAYSIWRDALLNLEHVDVIVSDKQARVNANPYIAIRDDASKRMIELGKLLGLTPDRTARANWDEIWPLLLGDEEDNDDGDMEGTRKDEGQVPDQD